MYVQCFAKTSARGTEFVIRKREHVCAIRFGCQTFSIFGVSGRPIVVSCNEMIAYCLLILNKLNCFVDWSILYVVIGVFLGFLSISGCCWGLTCMCRRTRKPRTRTKPQKYALLGTQEDEIPSCKFFFVLK